MGLDPSEEPARLGGEQSARAHIWAMKGKHGVCLSCKSAQESASQLVSCASVKDGMQHES